MTEYDKYSDHPLHGVPEEVLKVARDQMAEAGSEFGMDAGDVESVADAIVSALNTHGYITWTAGGADDRDRSRCDRDC